jgi:hypothetical protein
MFDLTDCKMHDSHDLTDSNGHGCALGPIPSSGTELRTKEVGPACVETVAGKLCHRGVLCVAGSIIICASREREIDRFVTTVMLVHGTRVKVKCWLPTIMWYTGDFVIWYILAAVLALALREAFWLVID